MNDLWEQFEKDVLPKKKPSTAKEYSRQWTKNIQPVLGRFKVTNVSRKNINGLHRSLKLSPTLANRVVDLC